MQSAGTATTSRNFWRFNNMTHWQLRVQRINILCTKFNYEVWIIKVISCKTADDARHFMNFIWLNVMLTALPYCKRPLLYRAAALIKTSLCRNLNVCAKSKFNEKLSINIRYSFKNRHCNSWVYELEVCKVHHNSSQLCKPELCNSVDEGWLSRTGFISRHPDFSQCRRSPWSRKSTPKSPGILDTGSLTNYYNLTKRTKPGNSESAWRPMITCHNWCSICAYGNDTIGERKYKTAKFLFKQLTAFSAGIEPLTLIRPRL